MDNSEVKETPKKEPAKPINKDKITTDQINTLKSMLTPEREPKLLDYFKVKKLEELTAHDFIEALSILQSAKK